MPVKGRVSHERMLCKLLHEDTGWFATRTGGTSMPWADVHLYHKVGINVWTNCVIFEVKSCVKKRKYFKPSERDQFKRYFDAAAQYGIAIIYAYRWVAHEKGDERDKWRFFRVSGISGNKLVWVDGMPYSAFMRELQ